MKKVAFIVPGSFEYTKEEKYQKIADYFHKSGIKPILIDITWPRKTMSDYISEFLEKISQYKADEIYLLGFSYGAMICFIASSQMKVKAQILCSLSPYFAEDMHRVRDWWAKRLGKNRMKDFKSRNASELVNKIIAQTFILAGTKEVKEVQLSNDKIYTQLKCKKERILIEGARHDISNPDYQKKIEEIIQNLN